MAAPTQGPISGVTRLAAVIGSPVRHSLSPALHNAAFAAAGLDWRFLAFEVAPGRGADAVSAMRTLGIRGLAVTTPHKADVVTAVDEVDAASAALRSVNTVLLRDDGSTFGVSTDGDGFVDSLRDAGVVIEGVKAVVLGAGGAARSIVQALDRHGAHTVTVVNRTASAAAAMLQYGDSITVGSVDAVEDAWLLVNATTVGMGTDDAPVPSAVLHAGLTVADIVYHPLDTALLRAARTAGARAVDGLGMLVHQAARQQLLWTGVAPDPGVLRAAAETELDTRVRP